MKTPEDEAFDELAKRQGSWGGGFPAKRQMAADKVLDLDGHVVGKARKPKGQQMPRDEEIARLNEKVEFLARGNMLYSDWEHRDAQVTSELIRKGIEEAKINAELRAEIEQLKAQLTQPAQEPVAWGVFEGNNLHDMLFTQEEAQELARYKGSHAEVRPLYTTPPQREWVGLTPEEILALVKTAPALDTAEAEWLHVVRAAEQSLKEKNNG